LYVGILNVVQVVAQLIIGAVAGAIMQAAVGLNLGSSSTGFSCLIFDRYADSKKHSDVSSFEN
jgi:hypothetical protein